MIRQKIFNGQRTRKIDYVKKFRFLCDGKSYDYIGIFLVNVFAHALSMALLHGVGKNAVACNEAESPWEKEEVADFKVTFQNLPGDTK